MGRHRKTAMEGHKIVKANQVPDHKRRKVVEDRLGLNDLVCQSCNARNDENAEKCRKCGHTNLRPKSGDYRDA